MDTVLTIAAVACLGIAIYLWAKSLRLKRAEFIRTYPWPPGLLDKLEQKHPALARKETALVSRGLRQFFIAHLMSGNKFVSMPSQAVDDLWHEFILYTRDYKEFCAKAFGSFLHHSPAVVLGPDSADTVNDGLRRAWWFACRDENIDPRNATRLPLLFALDGKLQILNGFRYDLNCDLLRKDGVTGIFCATDLLPVRAKRGCGGGAGGSGCGGGDGGCGGGGCGGGCGG
jgi:hypothetical protein